MVQRSILVVDDNELILFGLARALRHEAFAVETAGTGAGALEKLDSCRFDLCLLDILLPDFNGLELMQYIKDMCPHTKMVIMTASHFNSSSLSRNIQEAVNNGACQFVAKPFTLSEITEVVRKVLGQDGFYSNARFAGSGFGKCRREMQRRVFTDPVSFFITMIVEGESKRVTFQAKAVDCSGEGVGLLTDFPLQVGRIVSFSEELGNRSGVVIWSEVVDEQTYRAGVKFA